MNSNGGGWVCTARPSEIAICACTVLVGLSQRSSWLQRHLQVSPSNHSSFIVISGGSDFFMMMPLEPAGVAVAAPPEPRCIACRARLKVISFGLKSKGTMPRASGSKQVNVAGMSEPIALATPTTAPTAPVAAPMTPPPLAAPETLPVTLAPKLVVIGSSVSRSPRGSQEPLVDEFQPFHRDAGGLGVEVGAVPLARIAVAQLPGPHRLPGRVEERDLPGAARAARSVAPADRVADEVRTLLESAVAAARRVHPGVHPLAQPLLHPHRGRRLHRPLQRDRVVLDLTGQDRLVVVVAALVDRLGVEVDAQAGALAPAAEVDAVHHDVEARGQAEDGGETQGHRVSSGSGAASVGRAGQA